MFLERRVPVLEEGCEVAGWKLRKRECPLALPCCIVIDHVSGPQSEGYLTIEETILSGRYTGIGGPFPVMTDGESSLPRKP